jgi:hypothetical protein
MRIHGVTHRIEDNANSTPCNLPKYPTAHTRTDYHHAITHERRFSLQPSRADRAYTWLRSGYLQTTHKEMIDHGAIDRDRATNPWMTDRRDLPILETIPMQMMMRSHDSTRLKTGKGWKSRRYVDSAQERRELSRIDVHRRGGGQTAL